MRRSLPWPEDGCCGGAAAPLLDGFDGYCRQRDIPSTAWITEGDLDTLDLADKIIEALG